VVNCEDDNDDDGDDNDDDDNNINGKNYPIKNLTVSVVHWV
jgi:hypothetical protein